VRRGAARLRKRVFEQTSSDLNISLFDGRASTVADVLQAADTATFTLGTRLLLVTAADAWKAPTATRRRLSERPVPGVCLALVGETFRKTERLTKLLEKSGQVLRYDLPKRQSDVADWVRGRAQARGARLGRGRGPATSSPRWAPTPIFSRTSWPSWPPTRWAGR